MRKQSRKLALIIGLVLVSLAMLDGVAEAIIGRPFTPMSFAGVARRTTRRAVYGAAAYGGYGYGGYGYPAAVNTLPAGCVPGAPCGGVTYQPAYQGSQVVYIHDND